MTIVLLDRDRLKIRLNQAETRELKLDESRLDYRDPQVKGALISLLRKARAEAGFHPDGAKVIVEILPGDEGGCILCFTAIHGLRLSPGKTEIVPVIYAFDSAYDLVEAVTGLYQKYAHRIYESSLYTFWNRLLLVVRALDYCDRQSAYFLEEYARRIGSGEALAAIVGEHGELLAADNAIDKLGAIFSAFRG